MSYLQNMPYKQDIVLDDTFNYQGYNQRISIYKAFSVSNPDYYYLRLKMIRKEEIVTQGYIYFYLDFDKKISEFIGLAVAEEFRGNHLSMLLLSTYVSFCLEQGFDKMETIQKQKKPFLLHLLKKFRFDLENIDLYNKEKEFIISLCQRQLDPTKYLYFSNKKYEKQFCQSKIMQSDNYQILENPTLDIPIIDDVLLCKKYNLKDPESAYHKAQKVYKNHQL